MTQPVQVPPYSKIAAIYDGMMEHVEYKKWAEYVHAIFTQHGQNVRRVCELACGTGTIGITLSRLGYDMTCSDRSKDMVERAAAKAKEPDANIRFLVCDMTAFVSPQAFDAVLCLYDSVNYLMEEKDVAQWLMRCSALVSPGGLVVFDSCTETNSLQNFDERFELDRRHRYIRRSRYVRAERTQINEVEITINGRQYLETHHQRIYSVSTLLHLVQQSGFSLAALYEDLSFRRGSEKSERIHWVLQKKK